MEDKPELHIGILGAMPEEIGTFLSNLDSIVQKKYGDLIIFSGIWKVSTSKKIYLSICFSGWGKVSASRATTRLISSIYKEKEIDFLLFTGVAGAAKNNLKQWDIIISDSVVQHDMDASPIFDRYVVPALKTKKIEPSRELLINFENSLIDLKIKGRLSKFGNVYKGLLATGDQFITDKKIIESIASEFKNLYAIEMEGAAFAQVAQQENMEWLVIRVISDQADGEAHIDFETFLQDFKIYSWEIIEAFLIYLSK